MRYNSENPDALTIYARLALESRLANRDSSEQEAFEALLDRVLHLLKQVNSHSPSGKVNANKADVPLARQRSRRPVDRPIQPAPHHRGGLRQILQAAY